MKILAGWSGPAARRRWSSAARRPSRPPARRVGYLPEHFRFQEWATGAELLGFHGRLAGMGAAELAGRIPELLDRVGLAGRGGESASAATPRA